MAEGVDVTCRLEIRPMLEADPPALRVAALAWDSGFRGTELRPGDQILAVNGVPFERPATPEDLARVSQTTIGSTGEAAAWREAGLGDASAVRLTVRRRNVPGEGWRTFDVEGVLRPRSDCRDADGRPILGPGGPQYMYEDDGFGSAWGTWWDDQVAGEFAKILDDPLHALSQNTRFHLAENEERRKRVQFLVEHYPGPFATAVKSDFDEVMARLLGEPVPLSAADLQYRRDEAAEVERVRGLAQQAWEAAKQRVADGTIPTFPAPDPSQEDWKPFVGKYVVLGPLRNQDWISDSGRTWFVAGDGSRVWFLDAESPECSAALDALGRYRRLVAPNVDETYQFVAEVTDSPRLGMASGSAHFGLVVRPVAVLVGDAVFVDVSALPGDGPVPFAGEELFTAPAGALPPPEASPAEVMAAFVDAIKVGDPARWKALFADWRVERLSDGRPLLHPGSVARGDRDFEAARRLILERVYDARPVWTGDPRVVVDGSAFPGALRIEEVDVQLRHIGCFDGEYRPFTDVTVTEFWKLHRVNGGPWRLAADSMGVI